MIKGDAFGGVSWHPEAMNGGTGARRPFPPPQRCGRALGAFAAYPVVWALKRRYVGIACTNPASCRGRAHLPHRIP